MEQEKLYVIEKKTYEAHIDEEDHLYWQLHQLALLTGKIKDRRDMEKLIDTGRRYGEITALREQYPDLCRRALALEDNARKNLKMVKGLGRKYSWRERLGKKFCIHGNG